MKAISVRLTNAQGDELGRLPLAFVTAAAAGEAAAQETRLPRRAQIASLLSKIDDALHSQELQSAQSVVERERAVTLALALDEEGDELLIPLMIHTPALLPAKEEEGDGTPDRLSSLRWEDLLRVDADEEADHA